MSNDDFGSRAQREDATRAAYEHISSYHLQHGHEQMADIQSGHAANVAKAAAAGASHQAHLDRENAGNQAAAAAQGTGSGKGNPYHDKSGEFTSAGQASAGAAGSIARVYSKHRLA